MTRYLHRPSLKNDNFYDTKYSRKEYYWSKKPSAICDKIIEIMQPTKDHRPRLIDLGCGEGRNAVYFAKHDFDVVALDISQTGLEKTRRYAHKEGVPVKTVKADIVDFELQEKYDVIFSTGTIHYLPKKLRAERFENYKACTSPTGINAHSVFVKKPFIAKAPDADAKVQLYLSGELMSCYWDWEILHCAEEIFDCKSGNVPHKHAVNRIIARRHQE